MLFSGSGCSDTSGFDAGGFSSEGGVTGGFDETGADKTLSSPPSRELVCPGVTVGFCSADASDFLEVVPAVSGWLAEDDFSAASEDGTEEIFPALETCVPSGTLLSQSASTEDVPEVISAESGSEEEIVVVSGDSLDWQPVRATSKAVSKTKKSLRINDPPYVEFSSLYL